MQHYRYRAARDDGRTTRGVIGASSADEASITLVARGLHPLAIALDDRSQSGHRTAGRRELAVIFRSLAALVAAGVPVDRALVASEPLARGALRETIGRARESIGEGWSVAEALDSGGGVVPATVIGMIRAGERSGQLGRALDQVAQQLEDEAELVGRVQQALAYPALLAVAGTASVLVIGTVVIPRFADLLGDLGQELPFATRLLLSGSHLLVHSGPWLASGAVAASTAFVGWCRQPSGRLFAHRALLATPVLGPTRRLLATARFCRAISGMLQVGMPILSALDAARNALGDAALADRLTHARERVAQGQPLTASLEHEQVLAASALQLLTVGEASGQLAAMAGKAGDLAAAEAERAIRLLVGLLEPALVVLFGGVVAFVAAALLQAVYSVRPA